MQHKNKKNIKQVMQERILFLDGAMGTQIFDKNPTEEDYGGLQFEGCVELLNERRKNWIQEIHASYFTAGADAVETNTFGCNEIVLSEFDLAHRTYKLNYLAAKLAREVAESYEEEKFVIGSIGPGTKLVTLFQVDYDILYKSYLAQMEGLIAGNVDALLIETCQDLNQIKIAVRAARTISKKLQKDIPIWVQATIEATGTMLLGSDIQTALTTIEMLNVDVIGMNCAMGPDEMRAHVAYLSEASPFSVSVLPNAGLPLNVNGKTVYPLGPVDFAAKVSAMAKDFSLNIVGGCCGTTPEHIKELVRVAKNIPIVPRKAKYERSVSSLYTSVPYNLEPKPLYVGERTNANGSKKFKDLLAVNDYDGLVQIAKEQLKEGAHVLDVCVAYVSRNETEDMAEFLKRLVTQVNIPLMIDSTETPVIEKALQIAPGKCIVNSINFEDGETKARGVLALCKEYGASVVALTIDEEGMAKTCERKLEIATRIYNLAVGEFHLNPGDLIFDPLTFTLGSGDEEFRKSAIETLNAIKEIKQKYPEVQTILGLSNISFGLNPYTRQMINSMMLYYAVKNGLDLAILNSSKIIPIAKISEEDRKLFTDLIYDNRKENYDPLKTILAKFSNVKKSDAIQNNSRENLSIEEKLKLDIIDGEKQKVIVDCSEALKKYSALEIINSILLEGMKTVGERFGAGEMQLPFVLESAETMKTAVKTLEPFLEKNEGSTKGKILLATVKGDVHDIGKNLVEIILSNNGFDVINLGIKQPIESIVEKYKNSNADAIGLSGLLVKSTVIMKESLQYLKEHGFHVPVILGGAALTREFVENECYKTYEAPVFYARDAFEGLKIMELISQIKKENRVIDIHEIRSHFKPTEEENSKKTGNENKIKIVRKGEPKVELDAHGQSSWVRKTEKIPMPPFLGSKVVEENLENLFYFLDEFALLRSRFGFTQNTNQSNEDFDEIIKNKAYPIYQSLKRKLIEEKSLRARAIYGYYPACSLGNKIFVYDPSVTADIPPEQRKILTTYEMPRQESGRRLCIADFVKPVHSGEIDVLGMQLVTLGEEFSKQTAILYEEGKFSDYYYLHGVGTELTEAFAELIHKRIRLDLGIAGKDSKNLRQLFSQGYQGSRYSFGYPACEDLYGNKLLLDVLEAERIGVVISDSYQMQPELTTCALVCWHPQARYFSV